MLDENKWLAARHGLDGELVDLPQLRAGRRRGSSRGGCSTGCASTRQDLGLGRRARGHRGPAGARQRRRPPGGRLRGQPRPARGHGGDRGRDDAVRRRGPRRRLSRRVLQSVRERRRPGSVRRLQELRLGGQPVHHRVPVLRQAAAQARAEARARRHGRRAPQRRAADAARCRRAAPRRDPRHPRRHAAVRDDRARARAARRLRCCGARGLGRPRRPRARRQARDALVARCSRRCSSTTTPATSSSRWRRSRLFGWLLERRHGPIAVLAPVPGRRRRRACARDGGGRPGAGRAGRQRRRAGPAVRLGDPRPAGAARRRGGSTATCSGPRRSGSRSP